MLKKIHRKEFIRLAALGSVSLYLSACNSAPKKTVENTALTEPTKDSLPGISKGGANDVVYLQKGESNYDELRRGFNTRIDKFPAVIALCKTTAGVAMALQQAKKSGLAVAVKSGGHCMEGFSVNNDGMVINLSLLNHVQPVNENEITVGPGVKLAQLYEAILPEKRLLPAGACGGVGIGGLTLGGGYGFFSRKYGLTCDSLNALTIVDGKGEIHEATDNHELLWACRGGGTGNFGVATELTFKTQSTPAFFQNYRFRAFNVSVDKAVALMEKWFALSFNLPLSCFSAFVLNGKTVYILLTNYEDITPEVQNIINTLTSLTEKVTIGQPVEITRALKSFYGSLKPQAFQNSCAGLYKNFDEIKNFIPKIAEMVMGTPGMIYQVNTLGGNINNKDFEAASAYPHRSKPFVSELQTYWQEPHYGDKLMDQFRKVQDVFADNGILSHYCNYPYLGFTNWEKAYYGDTYGRLQDIKTKYDPDNLIRFEQSIKTQKV